MRPSRYTFSSFLWAARLAGSPMYPPVRPIPSGVRMARRFCLSLRCFQMHWTMRPTGRLRPIAKHSNTTSTPTSTSRSATGTVGSMTSSRQSWCSRCRRAPRPRTFSRPRRSRKPSASPASRAKLSCRSRPSGARMARRSCLLPLPSVGIQHSHMSATISTGCRQRAARNRRRSRPWQVSTPTQPFRLTANRCSSNMRPRTTRSITSTNFNT